MESHRNKKAFKIKIKHRQDLIDFEHKSRNVCN